MNKNETKLKEQIKNILQKTNEQVIYDNREYIAESGEVRTGPTKLTYREYEDRRVNVIYNLIQQEKVEAVERDREKIIPILADIGYTLEVMEDYLIDKKHDVVKNHFYHVKEQMKVVLERLADGGSE